MPDDLIKITDLTARFGLSSRSLRYYEQIGLIQSVRPPFEKYRFYDASAVERLKQIIVLRKMQIPVKDILRIYESEDMSAVVEVFVERIRAIDEEMGALSELKRIVGEFLRTMTANGITKISALPLLYDEMDKHLSVLEEHKPVTMAELEAVSEKLANPPDLTIVDLPPMRALTSFLKPDATESDFAGFSRYIQANGLPAAPGAHRRFEFQTGAGDALMVYVPEDFVNDSEYLDYTFDGGLFAAANVYLDEDLGRRFRAIVRELDANPYYQFAYRADGTSRCPTLLENLISPDDKRELVSMLVPVKKRLPNAALFDPARRIEHISLEEIEAANPILWSADVKMDKLIPINSPHYKVNEDGEAEYIPYISTRLLSTGVEVKLPFRVDIDFKNVRPTWQFGYGATEGSMCFYHDKKLYCINAECDPDPRLSKEAVKFNQPVYGDPELYRKIGAVEYNQYNRLTWIIGQKHFAVIINGETRYCGVNFPYMRADLTLQPSDPVVIGSNGQGLILLKAIRVSQLAQIKKPKIKGGELEMITKQSNNVIPNIHRLIIGEHGENYHFNGCARYVMEALGEYTTDSDLMTEEIFNCQKAVPDMGFWFFAGLTGDVLAQVYSYREYMGECVSACVFNRQGGGYFEEIFEKCGYASTFVSGKQLSANKEMYIQTLMAYIDKGVPVIAVTRGGPPWGIYIGYEEYGKTLLFLVGDKSEPERIPIEHIITEGGDIPQRVQASSSEIHVAKGWIFVGGKKRAIDIARVYRDIIYDMPKLLTAKTDDYCFGAEAFRAWAADIENGKFDNVKPEEFDGWGAHVSNICNMATNGSCAHNFLKRAQGLNPDMTFLEDVNKLYERTARIWNNDNGNDLEALGGGFNVTLDALRDKEKRAKIAAKIRECGECMDEVVRIVEDRNCHEIRCN